jgi:hypothetical protein
LGLFPFSVQTWFFELAAHVAFFHPLKVGTGFNMTSFVLVVTLCFHNVDGSSLKALSSLLSFAFK